VSRKAEEDVPERIKSLIMSKHLDRAIEDYKREELAALSVQSIYGIGSFLGIKPKLLEKWTLAASIVHNFVLGTGVVTTRRICIAGLSAAGKSSLIRTLQKQETTPVELPTFGLSIENLTFLGLKIAVWDLGGQARFRDMYLSAPDQYLSQTMLLLYVVDSQDESLADETAQYLDELLIKLKYLKESPKIYLTLHKYDPSIKESSLNSSIECLLAKVNPVFVKHGFPRYRVLRTSIYDVEGLVYLFSRIFADVSPLSNILSDSLAFYCESHGIMASYLITEAGFIAAEWTTQLTDVQTEEIFLEIMENIRKEVYESTKKHRSLTFASHSNRFFVTIDRIEFDNINLFLCSINQSLRAADDLEMISLHKEIRPWIMNFFSILIG
jgi:GTPase SAR1 family protein